MHKGRPTYVQRPFNRSLEANFIRLPWKRISSTHRAQITPGAQRIRELLPDELDALPAIVGGYGVYEHPRERFQGHGAQNIRHEPRGQVSPSNQGSLEHHNVLTGMTPGGGVQRQGRAVQTLGIICALG